MGVSRKSTLRAASCRSREVAAHRGERAVQRDRRREALAARQLTHRGDRRCRRAAPRRVEHRDGKPRGSAAARTPRSSSFMPSRSRPPSPPTDDRALRRGAPAARPQSRRSRSRCAGLPARPVTEVRGRPRASRLAQRVQGDLHERGEALEQQHPVLLDRSLSLVTSVARACRCVGSARRRIAPASQPRAVSRSRRLPPAIALQVRRQARSSSALREVAHLGLGGFERPSASCSAVASRCASTLALRRRPGRPRSLQLAESSAATHRTPGRWRPARPRPLRRRSRRLRRACAFGRLLARLARRRVAARCSSSARTRSSRRCASASAWSRSRGTQRTGQRRARAAAGFATGVARSSRLAAGFALGQRLRVTPPDRRRAGVAASPSRARGAVGRLDEQLGRAASPRRRAPAASRAPRPPTPAPAGARPRPDPAAASSSTRVASASRAQLLDRRLGALPRDVIAVALDALRSSPRRSARRRWSSARRVASCAATRCFCAARAWRADSWQPPQRLGCRDERPRAGRALRRRARASPPGAAARQRPRAARHARRRLRHRAAGARR